MRKKSISNRVKKFILWFDQISIGDIPFVGGKNASLGEMRRALIKKGINIPDGFAITSEAFWDFLKNSKITPPNLPLYKGRKVSILPPLKIRGGKGGVKNLKIEIKKILSSINVQNIQDLSEKSKQIRNLILAAEFPKDLEKEIVNAYKKLTNRYVDVAVRSSASAEDLPKASYAGQLESYLNIRGERQLLVTVKKCFASLYGARTISYSFDHKIDHKKIAVSVGVQKMVRSDLASAGVMFTLDTESGFQNVVMINGAYGLGENVVKGRVVPDQFFVFKPTLVSGFKPIISKTLGSKKKKLVYTSSAVEKYRSTKNVAVPYQLQKKFVLRDDEILTLARWACEIEKHYKAPQDIEWAKDGLDGKLYIVQSRPETIHKGREITEIEEYRLKISNFQFPISKILCRGLAIGSKIGQGKAHVIPSVKNIADFKEGEVLVTTMTDPDWVAAMRKARAIVTDSGARTCHAAIVSRELGVPCVVGTGNATQKIKTGKKVTVSCSEGEEGRVYDGFIPYQIKKFRIDNLQRPQTKIMMNLGEPDKAFSLSFIPCDGVGLAREEFIISNYIKIHPRALLEFNKLPDKKLKKQIENLTFEYKNKAQFFIDKLAEGVAKIAAAFYPRDVILRFSDFKTNEYAGLIGGNLYEPKEENPMLGWRGASRYYDPLYEKAFGLECQAIKKVREEFGLDNLIVMIPFCRTPEEGKKVIEIMRKFDLNRKSSCVTGYKLQDLRVYVMCEIPSNILLAKEFSQIFDGFSIGSNDLTQLILGVDRDSSLVSHIFNERNEAVKKMIAEVIKTAHKYGRKVGICGQAPSDFPDFAKFLVEAGIDSISLNPDTVLKTTIEIVKKEKAQ
ncbi:MAG: phosphoenolpyruvate synthase [Patescibacteria group bacterium]